MLNCLGDTWKGVNSDGLSAQFMFLVPKLRLGMHSTTLRVANVCLPHNRKYNGSGELTDWCVDVFRGFLESKALALGFFWSPKL